MCFQGHKLSCTTTVLVVPLLYLFIGFTLVFLGHKVSKFSFFFLHRDDNVVFMWNVYYCLV